MPDTDHLTESSARKTSSKSRFSALLSTSFFVAVLLFIAINLGLKNYVFVSAKDIATEPANSQGTATKPSNSWSWWIAQSYLKRSKAPELVVFGSSQMGSAMATADAQYLLAWVDVVTHRHIAFLEAELQKSFARPVEVLSLATPGSMISDGYIISRALFNNKNKPKVAVISIAPRDFMDSTLPFPASTEHFKYFSRYVDVSNVESYAYTEPFARLDFMLSKLPLRLLGMEIQSKTKAETSVETQAKSQKAADVLSSVTAVATAVSPGQWIVPANLPPVWADNSKEYILRFKNPHSDTYKAEMSFFAEWLKELHSQGIKVLVVGMPSLPMNRALLPDSFWSEFRANISLACKNNSAEWLDLTDNPLFQKSDYLDTVHLNAQGGFKLFPIIAASIATQSSLSTALKQPNFAAKHSFARRLDGREL